MFQCNFNFTILVVRVEISGNTGNVSVNFFGPAVFLVVFCPCGFVPAARGFRSVLSVLPCTWASAPMSVGGKFSHKEEHILCVPGLKPPFHGRSDYTPLLGTWKTETCS